MAITLKGSVVLAALLVASGLAGAAWSQDTPVYFAPEPGVAKSEVRTDRFVLQNAAVAISAQISGSHVEEIEFRNLNVSGSAKPTRVLPFVLLLGDGTVLSASDMKIIAVPKLVELDGHPGASRLSERIPGESIVVEFADEQDRLHVTWRVILRDGSNYIRQEIVVTAKSGDVLVREVRLLDWHSPTARVVGTVKGSPIVTDQFFAGFEDPLSTCAVAGGRARCWIERELPLKAGSRGSGALGAAPRCAAS
ncbi:MAG: hypothetical protein WAN69_02585 [Candidatus Korobacteraceae bacterium]